MLVTSYTAISYLLTALLLSELGLIFLLRNGATNEPANPQATRKVLKEPEPLESEMNRGREFLGNATHRKRVYVPPNVRFCDQMEFKVVNASIWRGYQAVIDLVKDVQGITYARKIMHPEISWEVFDNEVNTLWDLEGAPRIMQIVCEYKERKSYVGVYYDLEPFSIKNFNWKRVLYNIVLAIEEVRARGYAHRDVHPGNIRMVTKDDIVLIDFGYSLPLNSTKYSRTGWYPAPEMRDPTLPSNKIDLYQLGMFYFAMINGVQMKRDIKRGKFVFYSNEKRLLDSLLDKMIKKDPKKRIDIPEIKKHELFKDF